MVRSYFNKLQLGNFKKLKEDLITELYRVIMGQQYKSFDNISNEILKLKGQIDLVDEVINGLE